ncbi:MAG: NYN domain-containing protein [Acidimicrobiales bacterium]
MDGSNIATEGRSLPSLAQLDEAVRAISSEFPYESLTVVVDATFSHRIDDSEKDEFEAAILAGEIVTPPAGAIGRGDAFILQVAEKVGGIVLSNDSFQEFHGQHEWLFDQGRLIGGKPIDGVGWVFVERSPVRGPTSRRSVREAGGGSSGGGRGGRGNRSSSSRSRRSSTAGPAPKPSTSTPPPKRQASKKRQATSTSRDKPANKRDDSAKKRDADTNKNDGEKKKGPEPLNDPRTFVSFVAQYSIGDVVEGSVERFSSHGCYIRAAEAQCYLPSRAMGDPPPTRARDVVSQDQTVVVKVESLDANRRGINVVLVEVIPQSDDQSDNRERKQRQSRDTSDRDTRPANNPQARGIAADGDDAYEGHRTRSTDNVATSKPKTGSSKQTAKRAAKRGSSKKTTKPAAKTAATATSSDRVKRATAKKAPAKAPAKKAPAKKAANKTTKKAAAKKAPAKKAANKTTKKAAAKKAPAKKAPAKAAAKKAPAKKTAKKAPAKAAAKKAPAKKAAKKTTKKAAAKKA